MQNNSITRIVSGITLLFFGLTIVILLLWGIDFYITQPTFQDLEKKQTLEDGNRVKSAIENEIDNIGKLAIDWASWDDTYIFVQDHNPRYIESNYPDAMTFSQNSSVDLFAIFDQSGQSLIQGNFHPDFNKQIDLDIISGSEPAILKTLAPVFKNEEKMGGLLKTDHGIIILSAYPILNSQGQGPSRGVLIMGRFLTQATLGAISKRVAVKFDVLVVGDDRLTISEQALLPHLAFSAPLSKQEFKRDFLYQVYPDIENNPLLFLRSQARGEILTIGKDTRTFLNTVLFLISFILLTCLVIYRDRTKISEEALRDSEERYRTIFANKYTAMLLIDPTSAEIVDANPAACTFYGTSFDELKSLKISDINTLPQEEVNAAMELAVSGNGFMFNTKHRKLDGTICDVEVHSDPLTIKGKVLLFCIVHDITARKQAEVTQQESNHRLQTILNSISAVIYITDIQTHELLFVNDHGMKIFGNNIVGQQCWKIFQGLDGPCPFCTNNKLFTADNMPAGVYRWEFQNLVNQRWYDLADRALQWTDGRMVRMEVAIDITDRKQAEEIRLDFDRQFLQLQKSESLGRMAGAIAHNYNNLLSVVMGNLELAMKNSPGATDTIRQISDAMNAARRASEIGKLMLAYLGQGAGLREPLDLAKLCRLFLPDLRAGIPKQIELKSEFATPGPVVMANAVQIKQIVGNLATNAYEAMGDGPGVINLTIRTVSPKEIPTAHYFPVEFHPESIDYACLEVRDNGSGIAKIDIDNIFDPFFSTRFTGRGLGLPVVIGAVKTHGGCVTVESEVGQGCIFRIFLPLSVAPLPKIKSPGPKTSITLDIGTILVVEDEPTVCNLAADMLTHMGMTALKTKDGLEAIEVFKQHKGSICCVLCDLTMPRMDGWATLSALRQLAPGIPFILASGYDHTQVMVGDHSEWPQAFLSKPYTIAKLKNALIKAMQK
ncbi:MAG: two-component system cell cycle sensor histidine kinase/response regulator CckA [Desulforhopalus sp.]|jgi:two-component system cell cycle sensor histidine kinase/response regulator CckA